MYRVLSEAISLLWERWISLLQRMLQKSGSSDWVSKHERGNLRDSNWRPSVSICKSTLLKIKLSFLLEADSVSQQYTCASGYPSPEHISAICKICQGLCTRPVLNEMSSLYKVNGGSEGRPPRWNNGTCPWMLDLIPGVEGSFITPLGRRKRYGRQDLLDKLYEEWRDEWEMLFAARKKSAAWQSHDVYVSSDTRMEFNTLFSIPLCGWMIH